ncbi:hypothetical protein YC2023_051244 [Brassica napus]
MDGDLPTVRMRSCLDKRYSFELVFQFHRVEFNYDHLSKFMVILLKSGLSDQCEEAIDLKLKFIVRNIESILIGSSSTITNLLFERAS